MPYKDLDAYLASLTPEERRDIEYIASLYGDEVDEWEDAQREKNPMPENEDLDGATVEDIDAIIQQRDELLSAKYWLEKELGDAQLHAEELQRERDLLHADLVEGLELFKRFRDAGVLDFAALGYDETDAFCRDVDAYLDGHRGYEGELDAD